METEWFEDTTPDTPRLINESLSYEKERKKADKKILAYRNKLQNNLKNIDIFKKKISTMDDDEEHTEVKKRYANAIKVLKKDNDSIRHLIQRIQANLHTLFHRSKSTTAKEVSEEAVEPFTDIDEEDPEIKELEVLRDSDCKKEKVSEVAIGAAIVRGKNRILGSNTRKIKNFNDLLLSKENSINEYQKEVEKIKETLADRGRFLNNEKKLQMGRRISLLNKSILAAKEDIKDLNRKKDEYIKKNKLRRRS